MTLPSRSNSIGFIILPTSMKYAVYFGVSVRYILTYAFLPRELLTMRGVLSTEKRKLFPRGSKRLQTLRASEIRNRSADWRRQLLSDVAFGARFFIVGFVLDFSWRQTFSAPEFCSCIAATFVRAAFLWPLYQPSQPSNSNTQTKTIEKQEKKPRALKELAGLLQATCTETPLAVFTVGLEI